MFILIFFNNIRTLLQASTKFLQISYTVSLYTVSKLMACLRDRSSVRISAVRSTSSFIILSVAYMPSSKRRRNQWWKSKAVLRDTYTVNKIYEVKQVHYLENSLPFNIFSRLSLLETEEKQNWLVRSSYYISCPSTTLADQSKVRRRNIRWSGAIRPATPSKTKSASPKLPISDRSTRRSFVPTATSDSTDTEGIMSLTVRPEEGSTCIQ